MHRIFAIGDIHGCAKTLDFLLTSEIKLKKKDHLVFLGDYIDRGPDSKAVTDIILNLIRSGYSIRCLRGNHEQMMLDSTLDEYDYDFWISSCGGSATMQSFGVPDFDSLELRYQTFFKNLHYYAEIGKYIFVHAALNFSNEILFEDKQAMLWNRETKIDFQKLNDRYIIHGHTPSSIQKIRQQFADFEKRRLLCIDGGCVYHDARMPGYLVSVELTNRSLFVVENIDLIND